MSGACEETHVCNLFITQYTSRRAAILSLMGNVLYCKEQSIIETKTRKLKTMNARAPQNFPCLILKRKMKKQPQNLITYELNHGLNSWYKFISNKN